MCINPKTIYIDGEEYKVPCKKCILCRRKKCREWAIKLIHEGMYHKKMCMLTLTFRPRFLLRPIVKTLTKYKSKREIDGRVKRIPIKYKTMIGPHYIEDVKKTGWLVTLFMKKLRKEINNMYGDNIPLTYFAVGEHGSQNTHRAHWHIILFGIGPEELNSVNIGKSNKNKDILWSPIIDKLWNYEKMSIGKHTVSNVSNATIKYVANYTMKKMYKDAKGKEEYKTTMRFSNQQKIGIKWARRNHKELRKGLIMDQDQKKYPIPKQYYLEMLRFENSIENYSMRETAVIIEENQIETINKLKEKGLLSIEELRKKAYRLENSLKKLERDTC